MPHVMELEHLETRRVMAWRDTISGEKWKLSCLFRTSKSQLPSDTLIDDQSRFILQRSDLGKPWRWQVLGFYIQVIETNFHCRWLSMAILVGKKIITAGSGTINHSCSSRLAQWDPVTSYWQRVLIHYFMTLLWCLSMSWSFSLPKTTTAVFKILCPHRYCIT